MHFGYSDYVRLCLNGTLIYDGDDTFGSRDYGFLGTVGLHDAIYLPLRNGNNDVVLVVSESFGGWAAMAVFEDTEGVVFDPE